MIHPKTLTALALALILPLVMQTSDARVRAKKSPGDAIERVAGSDEVAKVKAPVETVDFPQASLRKYAFSFKQLGVLEPFHLRGVDPIYSVPFAVPTDEVVTQLKLKLDFSYSPSLIPYLSHLKVMVNGELAATVPLNKDQAGTDLTREVVIDPRLLTDFNRLNLQFIGHYTLDCEDPFHSSLWLHVSNLSSLEFTVTPLSVQNDLALLPSPFFDRRDNRRLELPFVFAEKPSADLLESAGIMSSWFGSLAAYRGAWFPASLNNLPNDDVIVLATNAEKPAGLDVPAITGPMLHIASHPADAKYKILYVLGRDAKELKTAATALSLGRMTMSGQTVAITGIEGPRPRQPYDAPNWVPSDRVVKLGELANAEDLNVAGYVPDLIRVNMRIPPDLFGWNSKGVPVDLKYRYTPRPFPDKSTLNVNVNKNFINSFPLRAFPSAASEEAITRRFIKSLLPDRLLPSREELFLPLQQITARGQVQFHFSFDYPKQGACKDVMLDNVRAAIDPDSTMDLTVFPHYIQMPNLSAFANAGFPFTRMADLSETAVVLPDTVSAPDIASYLTLMGRMGDSTGLPVYGISVGRAADVQKFADKDILLLGGTANQPLFNKWAGNVPFSVSGSSRAFSFSDWIQQRMPWYDTPSNEKGPLVKLSSVSLNKEAVIFGFQSPLRSGRSVVAIVSDKTSGLADALAALMDTDLISRIYGSLSIIRGKEIDSVVVGDQYHIGTLPPLTKLRWTLSNNSWILAVALIGAAILIGGLIYTILRAIASRRAKS